MPQLDIGRTVHVAVDPALNGGVPYAAATIVAVTGVDAADLSTGIVNVQVLQNAPGTRYLTNIPVHANQDDAREWLANGPAESAFAAWWPAGAAERDAAVTAMADLVTSDGAGQQD